MTLKDKLPDRLKCSPLLTMESDSDIETIAECLGNRNVANRDVADAQIGIDVPQVGAIGQVRVVPRVVGTG